MNGYLVDTDVISASAPSKRRSPELCGWLDRNSERIYLSTVTIAEVESGIEKARREGARRKASLLSEWLNAVLHLYADRVLPFDLPAARVAGRLLDIARAKSQSPGFADAAIAAIADAGGLVLLTHNWKHFAAFEIAVQDPFRALPE